MNHKPLKSGGINKVFKTYDEAVDYLNDQEAWPEGYYALTISPMTYEPWRMDRGEPAYEVVLIRRRAGGNR